jgi:hypothetical protein
MENPIVKIKRKLNGSGYPLASTLGEPAVNLFDNSFYIINGSANGITFGTEIDNSSSLSSDSNNKICTESAIISYASSVNTSGGYSSTLREANSNQTVGNTNDQTRILFDNLIFNEINGLNYSGGTFTNSSGSDMHLHVTYNVIFETESTNSSWKAAWIQLDGDPLKSKYGICYKTRGNFADTLNNILESPLSLTGSFSFPLLNNQGFAIFAHSRGTVNSSVSSEILKNKVSIFKF